MNSEDCIFCQIAAKTLPATIVFEDAQCVAFEDIFPKAPVHLLLIPKLHFSGPPEAAGREALVGHLVTVAADLAKRKGLEGKGYRLVLNSGEEAGQTVFHLHLHLLGGHALGNMG